MIGIVGAGITGLALAHELARRGAAFVVLEASPRPGGVIHSAEVGGHLLEWGPQRTRLTAPIAELIANLGLQDDLVMAPPGLPLFVYAGGRLRKVPFSVGEWLRGDLLSWGGKARVLLEPFTAGPRPGEAVGDYFTRKLGRQGYERLAGPLYGGLYASDPADMVVDLSLGHVLREFGVGRSLALTLLGRGGTVAAPGACSFRGGLASLPRALHHRHAAQVRLSTPAQDILAHGTGYRIETPSGSIEVETLVMTAPAPVAGRLLSGVAPEAAARIRSLHYNPLAVVHLHAEGGVPEALGYQVAFGEDLRTRGVTFNSSLFGRRGVYTVYLGGAAHPEVVEMDDAAIGALAVREFAQVTGVSPRVLSVARERMPAWDRSWYATQGLQLPPGVHIAANWESRPGIPGRLAQARRLAGVLAGDPLH